MKDVDLDGDALDELMERFPEDIENDVIVASERTGEERAKAVREWGNRKDARSQKRKREEMRSRLAASKRNRVSTVEELLKK